MSDLHDPNAVPAVEHLRVSVVEWPDGLLAGTDAWKRIAAQVAAEAPDLLITNELPFGDWIARAEGYVDAAAARYIEVHEAGIAALATLQAGSVLTSRPVRAAGRLLNEAVLIEGGQVASLRTKQVFPNEPGWWEGRWFIPGPVGREAFPVQTIHVGVLLCTEVMFTERARQLGRSGASLIAVPRASGLSHGMWKTAAAMASLSSGAFVASSNRIGQSVKTGPLFGGHGFVFGPGGELLGTTTPEKPILTVTVDAALARTAQADYPCYVTEWPDTLHAA